MKSIDAPTANDLLKESHDILQRVFDEQLMPTRPQNEAVCDLLLKIGKFFALQIDVAKEIEELKVNIGKKVMKKPHKEGVASHPFKSGSKTNTIKSVIEHPILHCPAYTFEEDDSYVACVGCLIIG